MNAIGLMAEATNTAEHNTPYGYRELWQDVLIRGIEDAMGRIEASSRNAVADYERRRASLWIGSEDFKIVCDLAGISASMVEAAFHRGAFETPIYNGGARRRNAA